MATRQWSVTTNGTYDFNGAANWQFGVVPDAIDVALLNTGANDTITGNATIAQIRTFSGAYSLAGTYTISGVLPTEISVSGSQLTILPGASINGNQAVSVFAGALFIQGTISASSLSIVNSSSVLISQGSVFDVSGPITIPAGAGALFGTPAPNQNAGPAIQFGDAIQTSGLVNLGSLGQQEIDFNGIISGSGSVICVSDDQVGDTVAINGNNTYSGGATINGGLTVAVGNANAFGTGTLTISGGELLATTTETIANPLAMTPFFGFTIAAVHNQTLTIGTGHWTLTPNAGAAITFGAAGQDGTVIFRDLPGGATINGGSYTVNVQAGILKSGGDSGLSFLVGGASNVTVQSSATLDSAGFDITLNQLSGGGRITNSAGLVSLSLTTGISGFSGVIDGAFTVSVSGLTVLTGNNTYTGGTTIANGAALALGLGNAAGSVTGGITDNGALLIGRSDAITLNNVSGTGGLTQEGPGTTTLGNDISYSGGTLIEGGTLAAGNLAALGSGNLTINGFNINGINPSGNAELLATATETISSPGTITLAGNSTIAAAHGQTLTINPGTLIFGANSITIGAIGQDGVVSFLFGAHGSNVTNPAAYTVTIQAGTLKAVDASLSLLLQVDTATTIQSGATLDIGGLSFTADNLQGGGQITNSGAAASLSLVGNGNFTGTISGPLSLTINGGATNLGGNSTYIGGTTISSGASLTLGSGDSSGSVVGTILDNGTLEINRSDTFALNNVTGSGRVIQQGSGTTILGSGVGYNGGTEIDAGILSVTNPSALGSSALTLAGGELLASATETIANPLIMSGNFTIAAGHGQTLTTSSSQQSVLNASAGEVISFGAAGQDGTVVYKNTGGAVFHNPGIYTVTVVTGTLKQADNDNGVDSLLGSDLVTIVQSGATLDAEFLLHANGLQGGGRITNSGTGTTLLVVNDGNFSGTIDGAMALSVLDSVTLLGTGIYTGGTTIASGAELALGNGGSAGSIAGDVTDNGTLEFHLTSTTVESGFISGSGNVAQDGSGRTILIQTNSYAGGTLLGDGTLELGKPGSAGSGAITFLHGTTSALQIDGMAMPSNQIVGFGNGDTIDLRNVVANGASYSGGVLTLKNGTTAVAQLNLGTIYAAGNDFRVAFDGHGGTQIGLVPPVADVNGDNRSDLLFQNTDGTPAIWEMNSTTPTSQVALSNPSSFWHLVGTGDVNGDGKSDLVWQAADGTPAIWEMNGTTPTNQVALSNPSSFWHVVGTGDVNGDGMSDLVWQAADGTPAIWEMNGTTPTSEVALFNSGTSWHLVGTGDVNGDGRSDLLWQNNDGTPAIWEINGTTPTDHEALFNPGPSWHLIGSGDFNGDGMSDLLWQNNDGTPAIWLMNGMTPTTQVALFNPGPSWHVIGAEDLNGDGKSDIVFQNDNGEPGVWLMNGTIPTLQTGLFDPGSSWHIIAGL